MRRRLFLMRHAEVSYFEEGGEPVRPEQVPLTPRGREQAEAARAALADTSFDLVVTSGLPRTLETAAIVAPGHEPERWPELEEWRSGRLEEVPDEEIERIFTGALVIRDEDDRFLAGERLGDVLDRVLAGVARLLSADWDTALAVLHGGTNRAILSHALAGGRTYLGRFEQAPGCINVLDVGETGWVVRTVNYVPYAPLHPERRTTMEELYDQYLPYRKGAPR